MGIKSSKSKFNISNKGTAGFIATSCGSVNVAGDVNVNVYDAAQNDLEFSDFDLPRLISTFQGREDEMQMLDSLFFTQKKKNVVICGLPGFGKTELSKQFANRCVENNKIHRVFWVNSKNKDDLRNSFKTLKKIYKQFIEKITMYVFDNAACMQDIFDYMPPDNENNLLLITSREKDWNDIKPVPLDPLTSAAAVEVYKSFLKEHYRDEHHDMYVELAAVVDCVPLGLQITGAFVRDQIMALQEKFDFGQYITLLQESKEDILNATIPSNVPNTYQKSIYGAICISLKKIATAQETKRGDLAISILYMCSHLNLDRIEFNDLLEVSAFKDLFKGKTNYENEIKLALNLLANLLLINYKQNGECLSMHRLIQDVVRLHLLRCDDEVRTRAYTASLQLTFETKGQFYYSSHCNSVLVYADENVPSILNFYKKHALKGNEILNRFLSSLTAFECLKCLTNIVEGNNNMNTKYTTEFNLLCQDLLKILKHYDVDFNKTDANQIGPLHVAAIKSNLRALKIITACNVDVNAIDCNGDTALFYFIFDTCERKKIDIDEVNQILNLLKLDENKNVRNNIGLTLLHYAARFSSHNTSVLHLLLKRGLDVNSKDDKKFTVLHAAAFQSNLNAVKLLIKHNVDVNARDCNGATALFYFIRGACKREKINIDEVNQIFNLLKLDENKNVRNNKGQTLLHYAAYYFSYNTELLHLLLKRGLDVNSTDDEHRTVLHLAALQGNLNTLKLLLEYKLDLNAKDCDGNTALFYFIRGACECDYINKDELNDILDVLQCKENKNYTNNWYNTLLFYAAESCHENIITLLITQCDMNVNHQNLLGDTPLHYFIKIQHLLPRSKEDIIRTVETLKKHGARLDIKNNNGETPLLLAREKRAEFLIPYLTETSIIPGAVGARE